MHGFLPALLPEAAPWLAHAHGPLSLIKQTAERLKLMLINVKIRSIAWVMGGLLVACALQAEAQAVAPAVSSAAVCAGNSVLKDFFGRPLPGSPAMSCAGGATPQAVLAEGRALPLYAFGTGPYPITNFGGIPRECSKLMPAGTSCFTTNPADTPLSESATCGYPAVPSYILACDASRCTAEIYSQACGSAYPDLSPDQVYSATTTPLNVAGAINGGADFASQSFASRLDFTANLDVAERIVRQGRTPVLGLGGLLMGSDGALRSTAAQDLGSAIAKYPSVFSAPGLAVVVYDEPFAGTEPLTLPRRVNGIKKSIALLNSRLPAATLGVVVAPVWSTDPLMVAAFEAILPGLQFVATDTYAQTLDAPTVDRTVSRARHFAAYMKIAHPSLDRWLVIQGFAPVFSALPNQWTPEQHALFAQLLNNLVDVASSDYAGVVVWGWSNAYELSDAYTGKFFPPALKQLYLSKSLGQ